MLLRYILFSVRDRASSPYLTDVCTVNITVRQVNIPHSVRNLPASITVHSQATHAGETVSVTHETPVTENTLEQVLRSETLKQNKMIPLYV